MLEQTIGSSGVPTLKERSERQMTVLINAAVIQGDRDGLCRIRNVSPTGLAIETSMPLTVGEPAIVTLHSGLTLSCVIRWAKDGRAGMSCGANPLDIIQNARAQNAQTTRHDEEMGPSLPRFSRSIAAQAVVLGFVYPCKMDSISARDVILTAIPTKVEAGKFMSIGIRGLGEFAATVRVSEGESLFASFATPISFAALDGWLTAEPWLRERSVASR